MDIEPDCREASDPFAYAATEGVPMPLRRNLMRRAALSLALLLSASALAFAVWIGLGGETFPIPLDFRDEASRLVLMSAAGLMAAGYLVFVGMVWLAASRERRQAEALALLRGNREALRLSRDQLRRVFGSLPLPYVLVRLDGGIAQANPQAMALFGLDPEGLSNIDFFDFYASPDFREELRGFLTDNGRLENFEITMHDAAGRPFWVLFSASRVEMDGESLLFAAFSDITERKRVEQALQKNETALREIIDASPVPVLLAGHERGEIVYVNQSAAIFFGRSIARLTGIAVTDCWESPEQYAALLAEIKTRGRIEDREARLVRADGRSCWVQLSAALLRLQEEPLIYTAFVDISERKSKESELHRLATTDPLTGALNRRAFTERSNDEVERARRGGHVVSVVACDLDRFKSINDTHGHATGDRVLKAFTAAVHDLIRPSDAFGRVGGEEFAILLPGSDAESAVRVAERIRARFEATQIAAADGGTIGATASFGVAAWHGEDAFENTLQAADEALYAAKTAGRNRVRTAPTGSANRSGRSSAAP
jgi:diguanylate cyclase (GGDEF)-like protein/PAS domain S-box-containing protein